jgi:hypothetical protein
MKAREFFTAMPRICGAQDIEREASLIGFMYDQNLCGDHAWKRTDFDRVSPDHRLQRAFNWDCTNKPAKEQCFRLVQIMDRKHHIDQGETQYQEELDELVEAAVSVEAMTPEVAEVMTVQEALMAGGWNG